MQINPFTRKKNLKSGYPPIVPDISADEPWLQEPDYNDDVLIVEDLDELDIYPDVGSFQVTDVIV